MPLARLQIIACVIVSVAVWRKQSANKDGAATPDQHGSGVVFANAAYEHRGLPGAPSAQGVGAPAGGTALETFGLNSGGLLLAVEYEPPWPAHGVFFFVCRFALSSLAQPHPQYAPSFCPDDEPAYESVDFTGAFTSAATASHNPSYETLARQNNGGAQGESNYESLDRGGEGNAGGTAVDAGPRVYDRLSRRGRQDSFRGFAGGKGGNNNDDDDSDGDPANHIYDSQPPSDTNQDPTYETQPLGNAAPAAALYKLGEGEGDSANAPRPVVVSHPLLFLVFYLFPPFPFFFCHAFGEPRPFCRCHVRDRSANIDADRSHNIECVEARQTYRFAPPSSCRHAGRRHPGQRRCGRTQQRRACR